MDHSEHGQKMTLTANTIKGIAAAAMAADHIAAIFLPAGHPLYIVLRMVGRITGPVFFFFIAEGYRRTRNANRYTLRLLIFAIISYLPYILAFHGRLPTGIEALDFNVIYTLLVGLLAIRVRHELKDPLLRRSLLLILLLCSIPGDWGVTGFLLILIFDVYEDFKKAAFCYSLFILVRFSLLDVFLSPFEGLLGRGEAAGFNAGHIIYLGLFLPLLLLSMYRGEKGRDGRIAQWSYYLFYPLHLALLALLRFLR